MALAMSAGSVTLNARSCFGSTAAFRPTTRTGIGRNVSVVTCAKGPSLKPKNNLAKVPCLATGFALAEGADPLMQSECCGSDRTSNLIFINLQVKYDSGEKQTSPAESAFTRRREIFVGRTAMTGFMSAVVGEVCFEKIMQQVHC